MTTWSALASGVLLLWHWGWVWLPVFFAIATWKLWFYYIRLHYTQNIDWVLLEVKLPKHIMKSPQAMEVALENFHNPSAGNVYIDQWWKGKVPNWFSLELVSIGGRVHFYVRVERSIKNIIESYLYAQYNDIEISEVPDYVDAIRVEQVPDEWDLIGVDYILSKDDAYPIKTYIDYELDVKKEEEKVDPLATVLEVLGAIQPEDQIWVSIMCQATRSRFRKPRDEKKETLLGWWWRNEYEDWKKQGKRLVETLMKRDRPLDANVISPALLMSPGERKIVEAVERSISKTAFDVGIRTLYIAPKDKLNKGYLGRLFALFSPFNTQHLNGFKFNGRTSVKYPWLDPLKVRVPKMKKRFFKAYRARGWFYPPHNLTKPFVLNTEEVATLFHFPGQAAATPTLGRLESKRTEPPVNLPV